MHAFRDLVIETIQTPDAVYAGRRDPSRRIYRKRYLEVSGLGESLDLLVFVGNTDRYVATAYFAAYSFRMLGTSIWPSS
jgi:hypothetical protein